MPNTTRYADEQLADRLEAIKDQLAQRIEALDDQAALYREQVAERRVPVGAGVG